MTTLSIILLAAGACLLAAGLLVLALANRRRTTQLKRLMKGRECPEEWGKHASLLRPWHEVATGLCITLAIPVFTHFCLGDVATNLVITLVGYVAGVLCALGAFSRQRQDWMELGGSALEAATLLRCLASFALGLLFLLWGAFSIALALFLAFHG